MATSPLDDTSRQVATLDPQWAQPGMQCRDPEDPVYGVWRATHRNLAGVLLWSSARDIHTWTGASRRSCHTRSLLRAIAAGPDYTDRATLGALLLGLPEPFIGHIDYNAIGWTADGGLTGWGTIEEAVLETVCKTISNPQTSLKDPTWMKP